MTETLGTYCIFWYQIYVLTISHICIGNESMFICLKWNSHLKVKSGIPLHVMISKSLFDIAGAIQANQCNQFELITESVYVVCGWWETGTTNKYANFVIIACVLVIVIHNQLSSTTSVPLCLSSIPFWDVPKYCIVSKNKSN